MIKYFMVIMFLFSVSAHAGTISYQICNKHGVSDKYVVVKDNKDNMKVVFSDTVPKDDCRSVSSEAGSGDHGNIEITVGNSSPYSVSWIKSGDIVSF